MAIGACATAGGIQALRNFADVKEFVAAVYARPEVIDTLKRSSPIAEHASSISSCAAVRSASTSYWRSSALTSPGANQTSPRTASVWNARCAARPA